MRSDQESETEIPRVKFSKEGMELEEGSEGWKAVSKTVREACESHGCFLLEEYRGISSELREEMFMAMKTLFDLPEQAKQKHSSPRPYRSYSAKCPIIPLSESFGIDDAPLPDIAHAFTHLMWPQGNPAFCETMRSMSSKMLELISLILKMIVEGFGLPQHYNSDVEMMTSTTNFRLMKYRVPSGSKDSEPGLVPHTDKSALTILCQNEVQGLQVLTKQGSWIQVNIPHQGLVVIVGDTLKAWSNGRLHAVTHRVMMSGDKERYSFGLFAMPKEETEVKVPNELVDKEHPLRYRPFKFGEYFYYYTSTLQGNALEVFAGV